MVVLALALAGCASDSGDEEGTDGSSGGSMETSADPMITVFDDPEAGPILTSGGKTLYVFALDIDENSNCHAGCAEVWPPLSGSDPGGDASGSFGTAMRIDGITQVTYDGQPLYFYQFDTEQGDTLGHGVNGVWFVATP